MKNKIKLIGSIQKYTKIFSVILLVAGECFVFSSDTKKKDSGKSKTAVKKNSSISDIPDNSFTNREKLEREMQIKKIKEMEQKAAVYRQENQFDKAVDTYLEIKKEWEELGKKNPALKGVKENIAKSSNAVHEVYFDWARTLYFRAEKSAKEEDYDLAIANLNKAIEVYPSCKEKITPFIKHYEKMRNAVSEKNKLKSLYPSEKEQREIQIMLRQAEQLYRTKQWDKARTKYQEVIIQDPYNTTAIEAVRKINIRLREAAKIRTGLTRNARNAASQWTGVVPLIRMESEDVSGNKTVVAKDNQESKIISKLKNLIIDNIQFEETSVQTVFQYLRSKSKEVDPEKIGINFVLRGNINQPFSDEEESESAGDNKKDQKKTEDESSKTEPITMFLSKVPLERVLEYICKVANLRYRVDENAVVVASKEIQLEDLQIKVYPVDSTTFNIPEGKTATDILTQRGMIFMGGASAQYRKNLNRLVIINTPEQLQFFENKIQPDLVKEDPQVLIQTKFVEVRLNDLEELGFKYTLSRANENVLALSNKDTTKVSLAEGETIKFGKDITSIYSANSDDSKYVYYSGMAQKQYDGTYSYTADSAKTIYYTKSPVQDSATGFTIGGEKINTNKKNEAAGEWSPTSTDGQAVNFSTFNEDGYKLNVQLYALDQADSTDILSCPRVTTMNETKATIELVTEKYYPEDWGEAQLSYMGNNVPVFIGSIPDLGDETQEGIILEVTPYVQKNETIYLQMVPMIRTFVGWDDYSYKIPMALGEEKLNVPNTMKMAKFSERTVNTQVYCDDNGTIVLGGLVDDKVYINESKYPVIADLPLIGRFFQSRGRKGIKGNLLIFLSCRLVKPDGSPLREREDRGLPAFKY